MRSVTDRTSMLDRAPRLLNVKFGQLLCEYCRALVLED